MEKFNFSKPEDQKKFQEMPSEQKEQIIEDAHEVANKENFEKSKNLEWSNAQNVDWYNMESFVNRHNAGITNEENKWRLPTKEELIEAIKSGKIDNTRSNVTRWSWSSSKAEGKKAEQIKSSGGFHESQLYYVVKNNGECETAALIEYGLRLVRNKEVKKSE
ncbi:MAG: hypothetical protein ACD_5C00089G0001 [uncultured bacterium]|nr:MAG: hypothetical protein ACD_5C00089G0001 [uncultured bacterium]